MAVVGARVARPWCNFQLPPPPPPPVLASMSTLFGCFTEGCIDFAESMRTKYGSRYFVIYVLGYITISVGVFNLITALFIDNVVTTQAERKQRELSDSFEAVEIALKESLVNLFSRSKASGIPPDVDEELHSLEKIFPTNRTARCRAQFECLSEVDTIIHHDQMEIWLEDEHFIETLEYAEIDVNNKAALFDALDADLGGSLTLTEMFNGLMKLRGPVTKADIIAMGLKVRHLVESIAEQPMATKQPSLLAAG
eukprot:TRINITY_DN22410_c0_g1_i1.p1 TRINITY_DN22410_c0_g1~~TRINITY_DN22410_c0_g1_i1.p1  ORF type:complete len:253 (+),score=43.62 TRINITY_DN22410_c0_g1_i1:334-1092(+)